MMTTDATAWVLSRLGLANDASVSALDIADALGEQDYTVQVGRRANHNVGHNGERWCVVVTYDDDFVSNEDGESAMIAMDHCMRDIMRHMQDRDAAAEDADEAARRADAWCAKADNEQEGE